MSRDLNAKIAKETLDIVKNGFYKNKNNQNVDISSSLNHCKNNTTLYRPNDELKLDNKVMNKTIVEIKSESSLQASKRLIEEGIENTVCLNFASAKNPGGGFLKGSNAQEESLARSSALYSCIKDMNEMYDYNKSLDTCLYSDYMIYSDKVPVFRNDSGDLLDEIYELSFITSPAVNKGIVMQRESKENKNLIHKVMKERIKKILKVGLLHGNDAIVVGAFGCGVFKNSPYDVARYFKEILLYDNEIKGKYKKIVFAIYKDDRTLRTFKEQLKGL